MGYEIHYSRIADRKERDAQALADMKDYLGDERFGLLTGAAQMCRTAEDVQSVNIACSFAGVDGYPVTALFRKYCMEAYRLWCASSRGGPPVEIDEDGFILHGKE
jgi:hypothetical protein